MNLELNNAIRLAKTKITELNKYKEKGLLNANTVAEIYMLETLVKNLALSGVVRSAKPKEKVKTKKCDYCQKRKNKDTMYFLLKEAQKEYWICQECNYEHDVV